MDSDKILYLDEKTIKNLQYYMPENEVLQQMANFFDIFSDGTRLKILSALSISKMCVNDISKSLNINQTTVSHQLRLLKSVNAVKDERVGKVVYYSIVDESINDIMMQGVNFLFGETETDMRA